MNCGWDGQELLIPYVLDASDGPDRLVVDAHLAGCHACAVEVRRWRGLLAALALSAPVRTPSPSVRVSLVTAVAARRHQASPRR